jgi:hypothetical protein
MHAYRKFYQWEKVHNPFDKDEPLKHYLVKVDDLGIFKELIEVSNSTLESKLYRAKEDGFYAGERAGIMECKAKIKKLPWWKRLFNKF